MRKVAFIIWILMVLTSCASTTVGLFKVETKTVNDIDGAINVKSMRFYYKDNGLYDVETISIAKVFRNNIENYRIEVGIWKTGDWLFIDTLKIKINNGETKTLEDRNPLRKVIPATSAGYMTIPTRIHELAYFSLNKDMIDEFRNCQSLVLQHKLEPITISQEAINAIINFLKEN